MADVLTDGGVGVPQQVLTAAGRARLEERLAAATAELERLQDEPSTREGGDIEARKRLETQIAEIKVILERAVSPTDVADDPAIVELGDAVEVEYDDGERERFVLVLPVEVDSEHGRISVESPVARALLGRRAGDVAEVAAPAGTYEVRIVERRRSD